MVGDGATDLEARQAGGAELFVGYAAAADVLCIMLPRYRPS